MHDITQLLICCQLSASREDPLLAGTERLGRGQRCTSAVLHSPGPSREGRAQHRDLDSLDASTRRGWRVPSSPRDLLQQPHSCTASPGASGSVAVTPWCCSPEADVTEERSLSHPARPCRLSSRCQGQPCLSADILTPAPLPRRVFPAVDALPWPGRCWQLCPPWLCCCGGKKSQPSLMGTAHLQGGGHQPPLRAQRNVQLGHQGRDTPWQRHRPAQAHSD